MDGDICYLFYQLWTGHGYIDYVFTAALTHTHGLAALAMTCVRSHVGTFTIQVPLCIQGLTALAVARLRSKVDRIYFKFPSMYIHGLAVLAVARLPSHVGTFTVMFHLVPVTYVCSNN